MYFSPSINGFQFGVSYAPEAKKEAQSNVADMTEGNDVTAIGARYDGAFGDAGVTMSVGFASQDNAEADATIEDMSAGLVVSMAGVSVGGSWRTTDMDDGSDDLVQFDAGISYSMDNMTVSANFGAGDQDGAVDSEFARLMANYNIGPGISVIGALGSDSNNMNDTDTTFAGIALTIDF